MRCGVLAILVSLGACWRGEDTPPAEPPPLALHQGASCQQVADNLRAVLASTDDKALASRAQPLRDIAHRRCNQDHWSIELRRCVAGAKSLDDADVCRGLATDQQKQAFEQELEVFDVSEDGQ